MVQTPSKPLTLEEFLKLPETKPASEYMDGQIIQKPMPQGKHSTIQGELVTVINAVVKPSANSSCFSRTAVYLWWTVNSARCVCVYLGQDSPRSQWRNCQRFPSSPRLNN